MIVQFCWQAWAGIHDGEVLLVVLGEVGICQHVLDMYELPISVMLLACILRFTNVIPGRIRAEDTVAAPSPEVLDLKEPISPSHVRDQSKDGLAGTGLPERFHSRGVQQVIEHRKITLLVKLPETATLELGSGGCGGGLRVNLPLRNFEPVRQQPLPRAVGDGVCQVDFDRLPIRSWKEHGAGNDANECAQMSRRAKTSLSAA
jgi:hypothetical protein